MWFRSQCGEILVNAQYIRIINYTGLMIVGVLGVTEEEFTLGTYNTTKRVLEVIDEIQNAIVENKIYQLPEK